MKAVQKPLSKRLLSTILSLLMLFTILPKETVLWANAEETPTSESAETPESTDEAVTILSSTLTENEVLTLTADTVLMLDETRFIAGIRGDYALTIVSNGTGRMLYSYPRTGNAIEVKSLKVDAPDITLNLLTCQTDYYGIITSLDVDINVSEFNSNSTIFSKKGNFKLTADNTKIDAADWQYGIYTPNGCFESYIKNGGLISGKTAIYSFQAPYIVADDLEITSAEGDGIWSRSNSHMIGDPTSDTHGIYIKGDNITINAGSDKEADGIEGMSAKLLGGKIRINATEGKNSRGIYLHSTKSSYAEILSPLTIESMGTGIDIENELSTDEMTFSNALTVTSNLFIDSENGYGFSTRTTYDKIVNSDSALRALFTSEFGLLKGGKGTYDSATDLPSQLTKNDRCTLLENSATTLIWVQNTSTSTTDEDGTEVPNYNKGEYIVGEHLPSPLLRIKSTMWAIRQLSAMRCL